MFATLLACSVAFAAQTAETLEFRRAFAMRKSDEATPTPDSAIKKCMDLIASRARKLNPSQVDDATLKEIATFYSLAVADEEGPETEFRSIGISYSQGFGRVAIGVRMGAVSRLRIFGMGSDRQVPVPGLFDWHYGYDSRPKLFPGGVLAVDSPRIQNPNVRYEYRIRLLRSEAKGFVQTHGFSGFWTEGEVRHLEFDGLTAVVRTITEPRAFSTRPEMRLFARESHLDFARPPSHLKVRSDANAAVQAVDAWMTKAMQNPKTENEQLFVQSYGKDRKLLNSFEEAILNDESFEVALAFDKVLVFSVSGKDMSVRFTGTRQPLTGMPQ